MSKGDKRRPTFVEEETFEERWARTFGGTPQEDREVVSGFDEAAAGKGEPVTEVEFYGPEEEQC